MYLLNHKLKISIITVTYNCSGTIQKTLESVSSQSNQDYEHVIFDGGSNDGTLDIIAEYAKNNFRVTYYAEKDDGLYDALNKAIARSKSDYVFILHGDDFFPHDACVEYIISNVLPSEADFYYGPIMMVGRYTRNWKISRYNKSALAHGWMPPHTGMIWSRSIIERLSVYKTNLGSSADYDYIIRAFMSSINHDMYTETLVTMRTGGISTRGVSALWQNFKNDYIILRNNKFRYPLLVALNKRIIKLNQF